MGERVDITLDAAGFLALLDEELGIVSASAAIAVAAVTKLPDTSSVEHDGVAFHVGQPPNVSDASRNDTVSWIVGSALAHAVDTLGFHCEEVWRFCCLARCGAAGPVQYPQGSPSSPTLRELSDAVLGKVSKEIDGSGVSEKLEALENAFGVVVQWKSEVRSLQLARNCLVHRRGIVALRDCNEANQLSLTLRNFGLTVISPDGKERRLQPPMMVEGGSTVWLKLDNVDVLPFPVGTRIKLSQEQLTMLLLTTRTVAGEIVKGAARYGASVFASVQKPI